VCGEPQITYEMKMNEAERKFKEKATITVKVTMPQLVWDEWNKDCETNFAGTRYLKMVHDHEFRKGFNSTANLIMQDLCDLRESVSDISSRCDDLEKSPVESTGPKTMGMKK